jgi:hypothetical protein
VGRIDCILTVVAELDDAHSYQAEIVLFVPLERITSSPCYPVDDEVDDVYRC